MVSTDFLSSKNWVMLSKTL